MKDMMKNIQPPVDNKRLEPRCGYIAISPAYSLHSSIIIDWYHCVHNRFYKIHEHQTHLIFDTLDKKYI